MEAQYPANWSERLIEWILNYPRTVIALVLFLTVLMAWNIPKIEIDPDIKNMLPPEVEVVKGINYIEDNFGGSELVVISLSDENIFDQAKLQRLVALTAEIENYELVDRVMGLTNAYQIVGTKDGFEVRDLIEKFPVNRLEQETLKQKIAKDDLIYGNLVSKDFHRTAIIAILKVGMASKSDNETYQFFQTLKQKYNQDFEIHLAGLPLTRREVAYTMQGDMKRFLPYGIILMIFLLVLSFRSWMGAFLPFIVVVICILNTVGLMGLLGLKFTFISIMIPVMLIAIANDYSIHLVAHYFEEYRRSTHRDKHYLLTKIWNYIKIPVLLAALTTILGFLSLQSHILPPARQMGLMSAFGITLALILSVTFVPAAMQLLDFPVALQLERGPQRIDQFFQRWARFFIRYRLGYLVATLGLVSLVATGIRKIIVDTNPMDYFRPDAEIWVSNKIIDENFGGSAQLAIIARGDLQDPFFLKKIEALSDTLAKEPSVTRVTSLVTMLKKMNRAFYGDSAIFEVLPKTREAVAQYLLLFSLSGRESELNQFVNYDYTEGQIVVRINETSSMKLHRMLKDTRHYVASYYAATEFPMITGIVALIGELVDMVVQGQMRSIIISIVAVSLVTMVIFRSLVAGLIAIIPLIGAVLIVFGLMGYAGIELNVATAMLSSIMIGVGIDYTIHFLYRFRYEVQQGFNAEEAVVRTMIISGKGIIYNAFSVIIGFTVLLLSGFMPIYFFGFLIVFSISSCLIGALTVMPAFLVTIRPRFIFDSKR
jgi:predicted RND superfamily exporter protein